MLNLLLIEPDDIQADIFEMALDEYFSITRVAYFTAATPLITQSDIVISVFAVGDDKVTGLHRFFNNTELGALPVLLVVTDDSREASMIEAYNHGASFYITKPYKVIQFTESVLAVKNQIETLGQMRRDREETALSTQEAIHQCRIYGMGMDLAASLVTTDSMPLLSKKILSTLKLNGIHCALEFRDLDQQHQFNCDDRDCEDNLAETFAVLKNQGTCYRFGRRCIINESDVSLLIKHVAHSEEALYETIIDVCVKTLIIAHAHYCQLRHKQALQETQLAVLELINAQDTQTGERGLKQLAGRLDKTVSGMSETSEKKAPGGARLLDMERF